jgi:hypothetical protein
VTPTPEGRRRRSGLDVAVYGVVATLIAAGLFGPPLAATLDPRLPVSTAYHRERAPTDPWGTPWVLVNGRPCSLGPDRLADPLPRDLADEARGDDVFVLDERDPRLELFHGAAEGLFGVAVALAVLWELARALGAQLRAPRGPLATEAGRVALLALPVAALIMALLGFGSHLLPVPALTSLFDELRARMLVPVELALFATVHAAATAVLLGVRLRAASLEDEGADEVGAKTTVDPDR